LLEGEGIAANNKYSKDGKELEGCEVQRSGLLGELGARSDEQRVLYTKILRQCPDLPFIRLRKYSRTIVKILQLVRCPNLRDNGISSKWPLFMAQRPHDAEAAELESSDGPSMDRFTRPPRCSRRDLRKRTFREKDALLKIRVGSSSDS